MSLRPSQLDRQAASTMVDLPHSRYPVMGRSGDDVHMALVVDAR